MKPINIVCLKWGTKYGPEYVNRLFAGFKRHTTIPFNFHCFTEDSSGIVPGVIIHTLPFNNLEGWWNKLYLFSREIALTGRVFFVDLDTLIVGNVDQIISQDTGFVVLQDFYKAVKDINTTRIGSGLMSFEAHKHSHIWEEFMKRPQSIIAETRPYGDQNWIEVQQLDRIYWQKLFPGQIVSFKAHCSSGLPTDARIVCYHGIPSIPDSITKTTKAQGKLFQPAPWVADHWID